MRTTKGPASRARRKKLLNKAKGYSRSKNRRLKVAKETVMRALRYARRDRRVRKRDMRSLWIVRISAAAKAEGVSYSRLMDGLKKADVQLNRKMLALLACNDPQSFSALVGLAKEKGGVANRQAA